MRRVHRVHRSRYPSCVIFRMAAHFRSTLFIWLSSVALFLAVCGGVFGLTQSFGHSVPPVLITNEPTLVAQPSIVSAGSTITLHGEGYTAGGMVGIYRDNSIPVSDQQQSTQTYANAQGIINTVVYVGANWGSGEHTIMAEDAATHKISSFPIAGDWEDGTIASGSSARIYQCGEFWCW